MIYFEGIATFSKLQSVSFFAQLRSITREIEQYDKNLVRKILFENIRVENIQEGRLFHVNVRFNSKYDKQPGRGIEDITFRNIIYNGVGENPSLLKGFDRERSVRNIIFDNVIINGMKMKNIDDFITNEYIKNITVK